jgi:hypothetical protein
MTSKSTTELLKEMNKKELIELVLHIVGMYTQSDLPFVYCPVCGQDLRNKKHKLKVKRK